MSDKNDFYIDKDGKVKLINSDERKRKGLSQSRSDGDKLKNNKRRGKSSGGTLSNIGKKIGDVFRFLVEWMRESWLNFALGIACGLVVVIALVAGIGAIANGIGGGTGQSTKPQTDGGYVQTLNINKDEYEGVLLEKTKDGGAAYLKETLFIGDSNYARIPLYDLLSIDNVIGIESMGIETVTSQKSVYFEDVKDPVTIPDAVGMMKRRRIVICFGTNNINDDDVTTFISEYGKALDAIRTAYPYSDVIICAIPPLGEARTNKSLTMDIVDQYNLALLDLAKSKSLTFLNTSEALKGTNGYMKTEYVYSDGIHFSQAGLEALLKYVCNHMHNVDDARPTPIGDIPKRKSAPVVSTGSSTFSLETVISNAEGTFRAAGHTVGSVSSSEQMSVVFSYPLEVKTGQYAGQEANIASAFYSYVLNNIKFSHGYKTLQVSLSGEKTATEYRFYATVAPAYCASGTHDLVEDTTKSVAATCTTKGKTVKICSKCGFVETTEIPMLEHNYDTTQTPPADKATVNATCGAEGYKYQYCTLCKQWVKITLPKNDAHNWVEDTTKTRVAATCTTAEIIYEKCSICGATRTVDGTAALGHTWGEWYGEIPSTCTVAGSHTHKCTVCEKEETQPLDLAAHSFSAGVCTVCGASDPNYTPPEGQGSGEGSGA